MPHGYTDCSKLVNLSGQKIFPLFRPLDSPTASKECLNIILAIISSRNWSLNPIDITITFLQGKMIDRDIFIAPPIEASPKNKLQKLEKCIQFEWCSPYLSYFAVWEHFKYLACKYSSLHYGVFMWHNKNNVLCGIFQSHGLLTIFCSLEMMNLKATL